ncbi:Alpha-monoglucosyldiacylglycerol synthase [Moorella thermoacetica]|uniref:Alpha-monoglucosyldiacylglycerol synthase n=1 Tax=Neomoorella thermoacetica TaxID=1525 RepID=A0AAC9MTQ0_NEOTH|nr:glycosyltransferase family 4 protein [Moorella thermoacetica]AOQ23833.1 Alpha-monoglucosyldiacylglycerol synthase [Moorella thermoacetica]TYL14018.1 Alpha-monoglucosyldiacylglycerol synthase [Moorella thermoacetica]
MHIGIFTDSYLPYTSGVVRSIVTFSRELRALGHRVVIFAPAYGHHGTEKDIYRFRSLRAPTFKEFALAIPVAPGLTNTLRQLGIDLIHVHSPFLMGQLGVRMARRLGLPLVATYHTLYEEYIHYFPLAPGLLRRVVRNYTLSFYNGCRLVITPTDTIARYLQENGLKVPVVSIPTGIELERFQDVDTGWLRRHLQLPREEIILLHVGRLGKEKNISFVLQAFAKIHGEVPATRLVLVGSGPLKGELEHQAHSLGIAQAVTFAGSFSFEQMPAVYAGADLFVFASVTETQGLVVGEAKAAGLPVVAVRARGVQEMVEDGRDGFLVPLDIETFSARIRQLVLDAGLRKEMGRQGRLNASSLAAATMARRLADQYQELLG